MRHRLSALVFMCVALIVAGCASGAQAPRSDGASPGQGTPRILRVGINQNEEPSAEQGGIGLYNNEVGYMVHTSLTVFDGTTGTLGPRIAERVPTVENGDWQVLPDGRMEVTWKLRPNILWHDGTPLTAEDVVFGFKIAMDPELFSRGTGVLRSIEGVTASDPQTVTMRWKEIYIYATDMGRNVLVPLPRHLIGAAYDAGNKQSLSASPYWTTEFVGAGPFSMGQWLQGSFMELNAFDRYFMGQPKIDKISVRYFGDVNALIVSTIAGEIDVIPVGSLKTEEAHTLATQWEAAGAGTVIQSHTRLRVGDWQFRDPAAPWVPDPRVRLAMVKLIDRQGMVDTIHNGLSAVWDIPLSAQDPAFRVAQERGLPNLSYDPTQAHRLLAEAGLTRGPDGAYRTQSGAPFSIDLLAQSDINTNVQELLAISGQWKTGGLDAPTSFVPGSVDWREAAGKVQGVYIGGQNPSYQSFRSYIGAEVSTQANRWRGANRAGYTDPAYDQLYNRLFTSVDVSQRTNVAADLVKMSLDGMLFLPLTYSSDVAAARKEVRGVTGVVPDQRVTPWNVHEWEIVR